MASIGTGSRSVHLSKVARMQRENRSLSLRQRLGSGDNAYGLLLSSASPLLAELIGYAGYDVIIVDMESGPLDSLSLLHVMQALSISQTPALVRVPESKPVCITMALDAGAAGVIVPSVDSAEAARKVVASCHRSRHAARSASRGHQFGLATPKLQEEADSPLTVVQIDSDIAVSRITEIAAVDGVDCLLLQHDLLAAR